MVAPTVEPIRHKRNRKNSCNLNPRMQFSGNFDGKMVAKLSQSRKSKTQEQNHVFKSFSNVNLNKNMQNNSYERKPIDVDYKDDVSSLEDYADCSETELEIQKHKGASITDAISVIMGEGGALDPNGSLLRPNFKKKAKNKNKKKKIAKSTASEKASNDKLPSYKLCSLTKNSMNVQHNYSSLSNRDKNNVAKNPSNASFPNKVSKCQSAIEIILNRNENYFGNALKMSKCQTGSESRIDEKNEAILKTQLPKNKKLKISSPSSNASLQVEERANSKDVFNLSMSGNEIKINSINPEYSKKSFKKIIKSSWRDSICTDNELSDGVQVLQQPFNCVRLPHFIVSSDNLLGRLCEELSQLHMLEKNNDMYKFHQSVELPQSGACLELREMFEGPVLRWLRKTTGIPLNDKVALSASLYLHSDVLLCHDDELEGRRVAFILYLTGGKEGVESSWNPQDGGSLDLFSCDESGCPQRVVQRLYPDHNTFAFFEVSPASFHQVSEVLSPHKVRLSVNGWFHGPDLERPPRPLPVHRRFLHPGHVELEEIYSWISPLFRTESLQSSVRKQFEKDSQIYLEDFVPEEKYAELCQALRNVPQDTWRWTGPPNRVHYQVAPSLCALPDAVQQLLRVLQSEAGLLVMAQLTGLPLHPLAPSDDSDDEDGDGAEDSELNSSNAEESAEESDEDERQGKKCLTKSKQGCVGGSGGEENSSEEEMVEQEEESMKTLKEILKKHKKASKHLLKHSNSVQEEPPKKKKRKRSRGMELDVSGMDQPWVPDVGLSNDQKGTQQGDCTSSMGRVYSSVRRIGHGCYTLILDDDNDGDSKDDNSGDMDTVPAAVADGDKKKKAVKSGVGITQNESFRGEAGKKIDSCRDCDNTGKKKKKSSGKKEECLQALQRSCGGEMETKKAGSSSDGDKFVLDLVYFVDVPEDWQESWGGYTAYVAKGEREELLTVTPRPNTLALVYRDADTFSFLKHVNCRAAATIEAGLNDRHYHALVCQYK